MVAPGAKTWVEINTSAFRNNVTVLRSLLEPGAVFQAVVKANAYGHEATTIVRLLASEGIKNFGVDSIEEALEIKDRASNADIFILGYTVPERIPNVVENDFIPTVYDMSSIESYAEEAMRQQKHVRLNLKIETGTRRQGIELKQLESFMIEFRRHERFISLHGVSSHFSDAENPAHPEYTSIQQNTFCDALLKLHEGGFNPPVQHIACSAAAILYPETHFTMARFGITTYGLWSSEDLRRKNRTSRRAIELIPVLAWKTRIAQVKEVPAHVSLGYSHGYITNRPMRIAVIPIGYSDGLRRSYSREGEVLIRGQRCKIIGNICMNMCMVDVSLLPQVAQNDTVTLLGRDGMHHISAEEIAQKTGTINYEVVTAINPRLPRVVI